MKRYLLSIYILLIGTLLTSCSDFLDVTPEGTPSQNTFFRTDKDATDAIDALYWIMGQETTFGRNLFYEQAGGGDDFIWGRSRGFNTLANFHFTGDESPLRENWEIFNQYIARANWIISSLLKKGTGNLSAIETRSLGEAYFMRGWCHFILAYRYGRADQGIPFTRYEDYGDGYDYSIPEQQTSVMKNYEMVVSDLDNAIKCLPYFSEYAESNWGRAHKAAAIALKVKVLAYWAQYDNSKWALIPELVNTLETDCGRGLLPHFADVFKIENNWSKEYIWSVTSKGSSEAGSEFPGVVLENKGWGKYNGWGYMKPTLGLYEEFKDGDERRAVTLLEYGQKFTFLGEERSYYSASDFESGFMLNKYMEPFSYGSNGDLTTNPHISQNGDDPTTDLNLPLIRFAEMVLFKAEALIQLGRGAEAATELNRLTSRAGLGNVYTIATMNDLMHERRCELAGEFTDRFADLKRWKQYDKLNAPKYGRHYADRTNPNSTWTKVQIWPLGSETRAFEPDYDMVFPYPTQEVAKAGGKLKQNPIGN
ncbi:MAG: RagB/SusD family nutrient uptake outer membrane protein [Parabacteroides sp.]